MRFERTMNPDSEVERRDEDMKTSSKFSRTTSRRTTPRTRDRGMTLPEVLIATIVTGTLVATLATAFAVVARSTPDAERRLAESKDVTFVQAWVPVDLRSAINSWDGIDDGAIRAEMAANDPAVTYNSVLEGVNVLTLLVPDESGKIQVISYRYAQRGDEWFIGRYLITDPGASTEEMKIIGLASEVAPPPEGWLPSDGVAHAIQVDSRNQAAVRPVGEDITVLFESGNEFSTGGAGLSAEQDLTPNDPTALPDPTAPPTRCGGRIAMLIDTSGSVPIQSGASATQDAAVGFVEAFVGTPTGLSLNAFDLQGYAMIDDPSVAASGTARYVAQGARAEFHSILDPSDPNVSMMINRIEQLDDIDGVPNGLGDVGGDGVYWNQIGPATNWEDGLYNIFYDASTGQLHNSYQPDLVVLITDGGPNQIRNGSGGATSANSSDAATAAAAMANQGRAQGSRVIGIMVGALANNSTYVDYLKQVVGQNEWTGQVNVDGSVDVGNAVAADFFTGSFSELGSVLRSIMIAECGGTLTVRKQLADGSTPPGNWNYSSPTGDQVLSTATQSSITFDFNFPSGTIQQTVRLTEEARSGYSFVRGDCSAGGSPLAAGDVVQQPDGIAGIDVVVRPDQAVSCVMVSEPS